MTASISFKKLAYGNDLKLLPYEYELAAVHSPVDYRIADARILCNPRGYFGAKMVPGFDRNRMVDI